MKRLLPFIRGYEKESVLAPLFKMLEAFFDLLVPLVVAGIIDKGIAAGDKAYVIRMVLLLLLLAAAGLTASITAQFFAAKAAVGFSTALRQTCFDHIQSFSDAELDRFGAGTLITRLTSDVNQAQNAVNMGLRLLLRSPFIVLGSMIAAFTIDVKCALVFAVAIPVLAVVVYGLMLISIPLFKKVQNNLDRVTVLTRENLTGVRVIRAFCREEDEIRKFDEQNETLTRVNEFVGRISALLNPVTYVLINIATIILIRQGALQVNLGELQQGEVVALYNYMAQMIVELVKLASLIITINRGIACGSRVADLLDVKPGMHYSEKGAAATKNGRGAAVKFDHVTFAYEGASSPALTDISFEAAPGQTIGIIGGTGSGKSTLVNLIPRFYDATEGTVTVDKTDVRDYGQGELIKKVGVVPQKAQLFEGSIRDNLRWGNEEASDEELWKAAESAQAAEVIRGKEGRLDHHLEQNGKNLSGGQRQRLTIARALAKRPDILILDDSASALDFATDAALRKALRQLDFQATTFLVSQRASTIREADQILVLDDGMLAGKGTHDSLMKSCPVYQEIYYSQFPEERPSSEKRQKRSKGSAEGKEAVTV